MSSEPDPGCNGPLAMLSERYAFHLARWTHDRTPGWARGAVDAREVVRETLSEVAQSMGSNDSIGTEGVLGRIRQVLSNRVRAKVLAARSEITPPVDCPQPAATAMFLNDGRAATELLEKYEAGLKRLTPIERDAVICRAELGLPWTDVAETLGKPGVAAARIAVRRALVRLAREMSDAS